MRYSCEVCEYQSNDPSNYNRHMKSKSHNKKIEKIKDDTNNKLLCTYCGMEFARLSNLSRHRKKCKDESAKNIRVVDKKIHEMEIEVFKKENERFREENENLKDQIDRLMKMLESAGGVVGRGMEIIDKNSNTIDNSVKTADKSMSLLTALNTHFKEGPVLGPLPNLKQLTYHNEDEYLIPRIAVNLYNKKAFIDFLTLIIRRQIEKVALPQRSFWNCDSSRNNFHIREDIDGKKVWTIDKGGKKVLKEVIDPVMSMVKRLVREYADNEYDKCIDMILDDDDNDSDYEISEMNSSRGNRVCRIIFMGSLSKKILKEISENYYMNYDKIMKYIDNKDLAKIDKEIGENPDVIRALKGIEDEYKKENVRYNKPTLRKWSEHKEIHGDFDDPEYEHGSRSSS